jgi:hypothetical protein
MANVQALLSDPTGELFLGKQDSSQTLIHRIPVRRVGREKILGQLRPIGDRQPSGDAVGFHGPVAIIVVTIKEDVIGK